MQEFSINVYTEGSSSHLFALSLIKKDSEYQRQTDWLYNLRTLTHVVECALTYIIIDISMSQLAVFY